MIDLHENTRKTVFIYLKYILYFKAFYILVMIIKNLTYFNFLIPLVSLVGALGTTIVWN